MGIEEWALSDEDLTTEAGLAVILEIDAWRTSIRQDHNKMMEQAKDKCTYWATRPIAASRCDIAIQSIYLVRRTTKQGLKAHGNSIQEPGIWPCSFEMLYDGRSKALGLWNLLVCGLLLRPKSKHVTGKRKTQIVLTSSTLFRKIISAMIYDRERSEEIAED